MNQVAWLGLLLLCPATAHAHPLGFGVLEIEERAADVRYVLRVSPEEGESADAVTLVWPEGCASEGESVVRERDGTLARSARLGCRVLSGELRIDGLSPDMSIVVRVHRSGATDLHRLDASSNTLAFASRADPLASFFRLGLTHALGGLDHLLFLLGIVFVARAPRRIALAVTAFTLGHALTLGLATLELLTVDVPTIELLIALSLVALSVELASSEASPSLGARHPALFSGAFGLLHGLGFATALAEHGLSPSERVVPLIGFHLGIELAQLGVVLAVLASMRLWSGSTKTPSLVAAYVVGSVGVMLVVERL